MWCTFQIDPHAPLCKCRKPDRDRGGWMTTEEMALTCNINLTSQTDSRHSLWAASTSENTECTLTCTTQSYRSVYISEADAAQRLTLTTEPWCYRQQQWRPSVSPPVVLTKKTEDSNYNRRYDQQAEPGPLACTMTTTIIQLTGSTVPCDLG